MLSELTSGGNVVDEGAVDFDLVEGETLQMAQRRIAGAKIIHSDADPEFAQAEKDGRGRRAVVQQDGFGDLQFEAVRRQPRSGRRTYQHLRERRVAQLCRRETDGDPEVRRPLRRGRARLPNDPFPDRDDQSSLFR